MKFPRERFGKKNILTLSNASLTSINTFEIKRESKSRSNSSNRYVSPTAVIEENSLDLIKEEENTGNS